jgi:hypothetical protein
MVDAAGAAPEVTGVVGCGGMKPPTTEAGMSLLDRFFLRRDLDGWMIPGSAIVTVFGEL